MEARLLSNSFSDVTQAIGDATKQRIVGARNFPPKFWSYVFEEAFSNGGLCLHWGDTMPARVKKNEKIEMKIDLRILYCSSTKRSDLSVGEFAKKAIPSKLYHDKLKQVCITKFHLNTLLLSGLPPSAALIPIMQIMGFECHLFVLKKVEDFYVLETIDVVTFPTSYKAIQDNGIKKLISCLEKAMVKYLASRIQSNIIHFNLIS
ncbi:MAG: hypothetical protein EXX96DRAFT_486491 [Benjaminiella poitrasii]|nr:MAG: hypothetical protein EXX96DRAFT_486491 [Benjaminiella poitrasii]